MLAPLILVFLTGASYAAAYAIGAPLLVPILNTLPALPFMWRPLGNGHADLAIARMLVWAAALGASATLLSYARPSETAQLFIHGDAYRREMFAWVATGIGAESSPRQFLPIHAAHAVIFALLSLGSASVLSMLMGAALMNYMGHFVGALAASSARPGLTMALAWVPWSLVRIVSFVTLGVVLAGPMLSRVRQVPFALRDHRATIALALGGLVVDVTMKWLLAPTWQQILRRVVGW